MKKTTRPLQSEWFLFIRCSRLTEGQIDLHVIFALEQGYHQ